jgi:porphobilinogen deaminase
VIRLATRGSALALAQARTVADALVAGGADGEQIRAVMRARRALSRELDSLRNRLEQLRTDSQ